MKKMNILVVLIMLTVSFDSAYAEINEGSYSFSLLTGGYFFEGNQNSKNAVTVGARAGYNFTKNWGAEGFFHYVSSKFDDTNGTNNVYVTGIEGLYYFFPDGRFVPFAAVGAGAFHYSDSRTSCEPTNFAVDYGIGVKYFLNRNISLRTDVRHIITFNDRYNDLLATIGINFDFFPAKKQAADNKPDDLPDPTPTGAATKPAEPPSPKTPAANVEQEPTPEPAAAPVTIPAPPPPAPAPLIEEKPVFKEKVSVTLHIEFDTAKAVIKKMYETDIKKVADFMKSHPETKVVIEGYTDNVDVYHDPGRNIRLSQSRADNVRKYLIEKFGIDASRVSAVGYGPAKPVASNDTPEGKKKNRRIEAVIEAVEE